MLESGTAPSKAGAAPLNWLPFDKSAPFLVPVKVERVIKKYSKLSNVLHFVGLQKLRAGLLPSLYYRLRQYQQC